MNQAKADWDEAVAHIEAAEQKKEEAEAALNSASANELSSQMRIESDMDLTYKKEIKTAEGTD